MATNESNSHAPLYFRIQQDILNQIQKGTLKPGQQLPTGAQLARHYKVSRITIKRAQDELVRLGLVFRQQGRGTFVALPRIREISGFCSFSEDIRAKGLVPSSKVLIFKKINPEKDICNKLDIEEGETAYLLKRLRLASEKPVAVETAYLPCNFFPDLLKEDLENNSLYTILKLKYKIIPTWADAEIEAAESTEEEASLLKIKIMQPVLIARRSTLTAGFKVIEVVKSVYRGDRFTFYAGRQFIG
jgi:GntR family transcriptional regulator